MKAKLLFISTFLLFALAIVAQHSQHLIPNSNLFQSAYSGFEKLTTNSTDPAKNLPFLLSPSDVVYDSIYDWKTDSTQIWKLHDKVVDISYNPNKDMLAYTFKLWENKTWVNSFKQVTNFNANNKETSRFSQNWDGNAWVNGSITTFTYTNNNMTESLAKGWDNLTNNWVNLEKETFIYDNKGNRLVAEHQDWVNNAWIGTFRYSSVFDSNNKSKEDVVEKYDSAGWMLLQRQFNKYDSKGNLVQRVSWALDSIRTDSIVCIYDNNNNILSFTTYNWRVNKKIWVEEGTMHATYDSNTNFIHSTNERFEKGKYFLENSFSNYYNSLNQVTDDVSFQWKYPEGTQVEFGDSTHYFIHNSSNGIGDVKTSKNNVLIYPNPSNGIFTISLENKRPIQNLEVYNVVGERILQQHQSNQVSIPNAQTGIYFVKIDDGVTIYTKKITVL